MVVVCALWEAYKAVGSPDGGSVFGVRVLPRADDASMPHVWEVLRRFGRPESAAEDSDPVAVAVLDAAWFTFRVAMVGLLLGVVVGFGLGMLMDRFAIAERGVLPYVVLSQTVPLVALAPLVVGWGGRLHIGELTWRPWMSVSVIAAYLAFFPIAVGVLRGLRSPSAHSLELMRSFSASWWQSFRRLQLPASVPYLIPALRLAAASAVVGAI
ncbi:MAG TPA: ABC transporter permease subunit, partial [Mycobacteriales bacterium]|nr:ABC transporter permease subunit [Mycobacteriales bacterium]